jgi:hypothetical protein
MMQQISAVILAIVLPGIIVLALFFSALHFTGIDITKPFGIPW